MQYVGGRRPDMDMPERSYTRRPIPSYAKISSKRDYGRRDELPPRSKIIDYSPRTPVESRSSYRDDYPPPRGSGYADKIPPRIGARTAARRGYIDESYEQRFERPPPSYRHTRSRDYESVSGSKRQYSALEDVPPRYADAGPRQSAWLDFWEGGSASHYGEAYNDRLGRSHLGYGAGSRSLSLLRTHMGFMEVVRVWVIVEVLMAAMMSVECTPATLMITSLVDLIISYRHHYIPVAAWVVAVTLEVVVVVVLDHHIIKTVLLCSSPTDHRKYRRAIWSREFVYDNRFS
ncbi:hypothetical protein MKX03_020274 [Papaver bracteatum]|nr:hypothetical protein MKX03_020274 [Papaver bracteatum]